MKEKKDLQATNQKSILYLLIITFIITISLFIFYPKNDFLPDKQKTFLVTRIIDGDTFEIDTGERVRLICINTPEKDNPGYETSKKFLENLIFNKTVTLEKDISDKDQYERLLRYAYVEDESTKGDGIIFVNREIVKQGFGELMPVEPDILHCNSINESINS
jgi:micrococcal nuclease